MASRLKPDQTYIRSGSKGEVTARRRHVRFALDCVAKLFGCRLQHLVLSFGRLVGRARRCGVY
jgi:hypothetical protein